MSTFSKASNKMPPDTLVVPPWVWATTWDERPDEEVCIGLRFVSDREAEDARFETLRECQRLYPDHQRSAETTALFIASLQDRLMRWLVGVGTCDPNDASQPWELFASAPEDIPKDALSDKGLQFIYDAWERMRIATSIGTAPASDADIALLPELAKRLPTLAAMSPAREQRARRLLRYVLEELEQAPEPEPPSA